MMSNDKFNFLLGCIKHIVIVAAIVTAGPFVTKLGMVMPHHEAYLSIFQGQSHMLIYQSMSFSILWWYVVIKVEPLL